MKLKRLLIGLVILGIAVVSIGYSAFVYVPQYYQGLAYASSDQKAYSADEELVVTNTRFGLATLKELQTEDQDKNIFFSPLSISMALAMTYNGAQGSTKTAIAETMELGDMSLEKVNEGYLNLIESLENADQLVSLRIANSVWMTEKFAPLVYQNFTNRMGSYFKGDLFNRPFEDPKTIGDINSWIREKTNGKIDKMIDEIDPNMVMFLINAIYFKGGWSKEFDASRTEKGDFHLADDNIVKADMMFVEGTFSYYSGSTVEAVRLPYGRNKTAMYVFLPEPNVSLESFIEGLNQTNFEGYISQLSATDNLEVWFPKFKLEYGKKRLTMLSPRWEWG